tara:strand:- start:2141 stop:3052 length:912 start_codon:yes stop_codon:yes gene_type:complete
MNKGYQYELELSQRYSKFNARNAPLGSSGMDLRFAVKGVPINVEVKYTESFSGAKNLNYGQSKFYQLSNGKWDFTDKTSEEGEQRTSILTSAGILEFINKKWNQKSLLEENLKLARTKEEKKRVAAQERLRLGGEFRVGLIDNRAAFKYSAKKIEYVKDEDYPFTNLSLLKNAVQSYYSRKGADYVQIKNFGLYRLSSRDPISELSGGKISIPLFNPSSVLVRIRLKGYGRGNYSFTAALEAYGFPSNTISASETVVKDIREDDSETSYNEKRRTSYKVGKFFKSDLDDINFKNYLNFLNQSS